LSISARTIAVSAYIVRVLIGTLYTGENEFEQCKRSLQQQTHTDWEHVVYRHLPNKEAHDRLYRTFMEQSEDFDLFVKLDADMVFRSNASLQTLVNLFDSEPVLDHALLAVRDWASDSLIMGLHAYSNRAVWTSSDEKLFVDHSPSVPGKRLTTKKPPAPLVDHSPDPTPFQAFRFGVHRALKVVQRDRSELDFFRSRMQWNLLNNVQRRFKKTGHRRLGLIVAGAKEVFAGTITRTEYDDTSGDLHERFSKLYGDCTAGMLRSVLPSWGETSHYKWKEFVKIVGLNRIVKSACAAIPKRTAAIVYRQISSKYITNMR
jgi:hypothetical protein